MLCVQKNKYVMVVYILHLQIHFFSIYIFHHAAIKKNIFFDFLIHYIVLV